MEEMFNASLWWFNIASQYSVTVTSSLSLSWVIIIIHPSAAEQVICYACAPLCVEQEIMHVERYAWGHKRIMPVKNILLCINNVWNKGDIPRLGTRGHLHPNYTKTVVFSTSLLYFSMQIGIWLYPIHLTVQWRQAQTRWVRGALALPCLYIHAIKRLHKRLKRAISQYLQGSIQPLSVI